MLILGHRGAPWEATENTLESFAMARLAGADGVELDVRLCATGEVVCCHDVTLERLTGRAVRVRATSLSALRRYDLGRGSRIARLDDALDLWVGRGLVNIELKADDVDLDALVRAVAAVIDRAPRARVLVSSFEPEALLRLAALRPRLPRGLLVDASARPSAWALATRAKAVLPRAVHLWYGDALPARVEALRAAGAAVVAWTVDDDARARALRQAGVSAVITNAPGAMRRSIGVEGDHPHGRERWDLPL